MNSDENKNGGLIRMRKKFLKQSLKTRIIYLYTIFVLVLMGGITFYTYYFNVNLLKHKEDSILQDSLAYLEQTISARIELVNDEYINVFDDKQFLQLYLGSQKSEMDKGTRLKLNNDFQIYLAELKMRNHDIIDAINLYTSDGQVFSSEYRYQMTFEQFQKTTNYSDCMKNKNKILYRNMEVDNGQFHMLRSFYFLDNGKSNYPSVGYLSEDDEDYSTLVFSLKKKYLRNVISEEAIERQVSVLIIDQNGKIVVREGAMDWMSEEERSELINEIEDYVSQGYQGNFEKNRAGIHMRQMDIADWSIVYIYNMNILYQQAGQIRKVAVVMFTLAVVVVFLIASFISRTVTKPIRLLAKSMDEAIENNMEVVFETKYEDEIAYLGNKFSELMHRVSTLLTEVKSIEKQKNVEQQKALQAQINPHFLYNTLDMVYWLAKMERQDNIANIIADLADFFRLSLNKGEDITTVKKETEHVQKYLEIQRVRMDEKFDYEITIDSNVEESNVPKLILQPFVENTLIHGFQSVNYQGKIRISVIREEEDIIFFIEDNGIGMDKDLLETLNDSRQIERGEHGYAIGNVRERIYLYSGNKHNIAFDTSVEQGTRVQIRFPFEFKEEVKYDENVSR